ncbi:MAG: C-terminal helicase domain-containing protein, partial [Candidatus Micrarchaeota archaeon]
HKFPVLIHLLKEKNPKLAIIFTRTKRGADSLFYGLERRHLKAVLLHGNLTQSRRDHSMHSFRNMHANILVATDIAARGIDVDDVELIVNYNMPEDHMVYAHRIGRTARAGKSGESVTFVTNVEEKRQLDQFSRALKCNINELLTQGMNLPELKEEYEYRGFGKRPENMSRFSDRDDRGRGGRPSYHRGGERRGSSQGGHSGRSQHGSRHQGSHSSAHNRNYRR